MKLGELPVLRKIKEEIDKEPFILSHHPFCKRFEKHVVEIRGYKVCMGCLFTYSSALVTILAVNLVAIFHQWDYMTLFYAGIFFFGIALIRKFFLDDDKLDKKIHIVFRIVLGISFGLEMTVIQFSSGRDRLFLTIFIVAVIITYNVLNGMKNRKICKTCEQYHLFPHCEGAAPIAPNFKRK